MRISFLSFISLAIFMMLISCKEVKETTEVKNSSETMEATNTPDKLLRHVVMFKWKEGTATEKINEIESAFKALPAKIPQIVDFEWGLNNSPEGLDKGFTHVFFLSFASEEDRAIYLPHPDHKAFGAILGESLDDVMVLDYWITD